MAPPDIDSTRLASLRVPLHAELHRLAVCEGLEPFLLDAYAGAMLRGLPSECSGDRQAVQTCLPAAVR